MQSFSGDLPHQTRLFSGKQKQLLLLEYIESIVYEDNCQGKSQDL